MILKIIYKILPSRWKKQLSNFRVLAKEYAQYDTIKNNICINKQKDFIPWYTYPAIEFLNNIDFSQKSIFEYGSGFSSFFWSKKVREILSIESDKKWFDKINSNINKNQTVLFRKNDVEYESSIKETNKMFDVVIIDGIRRIECSRIIKEYLNYGSEEGFIIILDNSDWYKNICKYFRDSLNLIEIDFHGFGPINSYTWTTSIFLSRNYNFKPINNIQPCFSIAGKNIQDD